MNQKDKKAIDRYLKKLELARSIGVQAANETASEKALRIFRLQRDPGYFVEYYLPHYATCESADFHIEWAEMVAKDPLFKGFFEAGRGLAKSVWDNVVIPLWLWARGEKVYFVLIGNNGTRAEQLLEDIKAEFEANPRIIADFGEQKNIGNWEDGFFITQSGFIGQSLGMGQSTRGLRVGNLRPNLISCDDLEDKQLVKNPKRQNDEAKWIERELIPTMDGPVRRFIYGNNRFAPRMIQTILQTRHPKWKVHRVNAYDPTTYEPRWKAKYGPDYYRQIEEEIGILAAKAEYNNSPHVEGEIFKEEDIQWTKLPRIDHFELIVLHWDIAYAGTSTSDFNAIRAWGLKDKKFYLIDCYVRQSKMRAAADWLCAYKKSLPEGVIIHCRFESQFWNDEVERTIAEAEKAHGIELNLMKVDTPRANKYDRILSLQPYYQNGRIYYNEKLKAHNDTAEGLSQLYGIEPGYKSKDDAPDADEQAISFLSKHARMGSYAPPQTGSYTSKNRF